VPTLQEIESAAGALKVFPLPSAVLLPGSATPLHIFETRYRELVRDCLDANGIMALAQPEPGWESDYAGRPPLQPIGCAGFVIWNEALSDGRYNIILQGTVRVRLLAELPPRKLYREFHVGLLPDRLETYPEEELLRQAVLELATHANGSGIGSLIKIAARTHGGPLADIVASALVAKTERRQELLSLLDGRTRLQEVVKELGELIARVAPSHTTGARN
jgi:Lon protease-like protein